MSKDLSWLRTLPGNPLVVAEIKSCSPYGWKNPLNWLAQLAICETVADVISVHTDPLWGGSIELLATIRKMTTKPVLAKGFHPTIKHVEMAFKAGATYCLTVGWWPGDHRCWFEMERPEDLYEHRASRKVCNSRNPRTGKLGVLSPRVMRASHAGWLCQASNIKGPQDVISGMDAILIGEGLYT